MISKTVYVYFQLPRELDPVTVGKFSWEKTGANSELGHFVYAQTYLKNPNRLALNPFEMPLLERKFSETKNEGVHGPIRDASPDSWGRYVIQKNTPSSEHDPVGYLIHSAGDRIGALSFGFGKTPPAPVRDFNKTIDLNKLIQAAHKLENNEPLDLAEKSLLMVGPSAGGARPKTTIENDNSLWLAKFPSVNDRQNFSRIEYITMKLAKKCGLNVPEIDLVKIGAHEVFLIKRFDRQFNSEEQKYYRTHFASGLTLLNVDETDYLNWSYIELADQMRRWIENPKNDLHELFRRIVFNGLISNTDDHPRNHGFILGPNGYHMSPVYDLVPKPETGKDRYLAMKLGNSGRIFNLENLLSSADAFDLTKDEASKIFKVMQKNIQDWMSFYKSQGLIKNDIEYLGTAFDYWK